MKTYIVAPSRRVFDHIVREMGLLRRDAVYISHVHQTRGLTLQPEQVIYAEDAHTLVDYNAIVQRLTLAIHLGEQRSHDDQRTHRLTITDLDGNTVGTRLVTARQAKDALG